MGRTSWGGYTCPEGGTHDILDTGKVLNVVPWRISAGLNEFSIIESAREGRGRGVKVYSWLCPLPAPTHRGIIRKRLIAL